MNLNNYRKFNNIFLYIYLDINNHVTTRRNKILQFFITIKINQIFLFKKN